MSDAPGRGHPLQRPLGGHARAHDPERPRHEALLRRGAQLTKEAKNGDPRSLGGIDLPTVQKWINHWFSYSLDLFGAEVSSNAADYFAAGLKGRWRESQLYDEHTALNQIKLIPDVVSGRLVDIEVPLRNALNEERRDTYI